MVLMELAGTQEDLMPFEITISDKLIDIIEHLCSQLKATPPKRCMHWQASLS